MGLALYSNFSQWQLDADESEDFDGRREKEE